MASRLNSAPVAFLAAGDGADQAELAHAWHAVLARGGHPVLISPVDGDVQLRRGLQRASSMPADVTLPEVSARDFAGLVLPGGIVSVDQLRVNPTAVAVIREFFAAGLPVAAIGHAPWLLIDADVVGDRRLTSWPSIRRDLTNAGASWRGDPVVRCEHGRSVLVTAMGRTDLPAFCAAFTRELCGAG